MRMKRFFSIFIITSFALSSIALAQKTNIDSSLDGIVRGFIWGIPPSIIQQEETSTALGSEGNALFYLDNIDGRKSTIGYEFDDNKLWRVKIFNEKEYVDMLGRIDDLMVTQQRLTEKFGPPVSEDLLWKDKKEQESPESWGWAVYRGELFFETIWREGNTQVNAYLGAETRYTPEMTVTYENIQTKQALQAEKKKQDKILFQP